MNKFIEKDIRAWFSLNGFHEAESVFKQTLCIAKENQTSESMHNWIIQTTNPESWLGYSFAAILLNQCVWFANPYWGSNEQKQLSRIVQADVLCNDEGISWQPNMRQSSTTAQSILIATGGTSGKMRFARHTPDTLTAAVESLAQYLFKRAPEIGDFPFYCDLPLWHVSGWMQAYRAFHAHSQLRFADKSSAFEDCWVSLVPTQLRRYLDNNEKVASLIQSRGIFIGGAHCPPELAGRAAELGISLFLTYGMTETAGMIAATPAIPAMGDRLSYEIFPEIDLRVDNGSRLMVKSDSLFKGYNFDNQTEQHWLSDDLGVLDEKNITILGRADQIIITGGEKVLPAEIEQTIQKYLGLSNVCVSSIPDGQWGQKIIVLYENEDPIDEDYAKLKLRKHLVAYKIPKRWIHCIQLPYDERGKISSQAIQALLHNSIVK